MAEVDLESLGSQRLGAEEFLSFSLPSTESAKSSFFGLDFVFYI